MKSKKAEHQKATKMPKMTGEMEAADVTWNYRNLAGQKDLGIEMINKGNSVTNKKAC